MPEQQELQEQEEKGMLWQRPLTNQQMQQTRRWSCIHVRPLRVVKL
jgi:hypothetical protein